MSSTATAAATRGSGRPVLLFVAAVVALGAGVIVHALLALRYAPVNGYSVLLAVLTVTAGRFAVKVPGYPAKVSVSELFVFASVLLFGPAQATLTLALDGLSASMTQRRRHWHRALFNVAEPAISIWIAGHVFYALGPAGPVVHGPLTTSTLLVPTAAMATTYFLLNSLLTAVALALENNGSVFAIWRMHGLHLALNYYAAASLAVLVADSVDRLNLAMLGLGAPLLLLSYFAYQTASKRLIEADRHVSEIDRLYHSTVETLAIAVDAKDQVTHGHIRRVQRHTVAVARTLGVTDPIELKAIEAASLLHDVGKLAIPDYVLNKPGALSPSEYERIKTHATIGATILGAVDFPYPVVPLVKHHHESWDGTGYPDRLAGEEIPLGARILSVVDCFDALTSDCPYRRRLTDAQAIDLLQERRGRMYDPVVVDAFVALIPQLRLADRQLDANPAVGIALGSQSAESWGRVNSASADVVPPTLPPLQGNAPRLVAQIQRDMPSVEVCVFAVDASADRLVPAFVTPGLRAVANPQLRLGEGLSGWVAAHRHTIVNSDPGLDLGPSSAVLALRSCTSIPIFSASTIVGVLTVYAPRAAAFSQDDVHRLGELAQELPRTGHFGRRRTEPAAVA